MREHRRAVAITWVRVMEVERKGKMQGEGRETYTRRTRTREGGKECRSWRSGSYEERAMTKPERWENMQL